jgi:hypothetical protein
MRVLLSISTIRGAVKKFPEFFDFDGLLHRELVPPGQRVTVQVVQRKRRDKRQAGPVVSAPSHTSLVVSSPNRRTLRISLPVTFGCSLLCTLPQEDTLRNRGGQQMECEGRTPEDSYRSLPLVLSTVAGSMGQVCARKVPTVKAIG